MLVQQVVEVVDHVVDPLAVLVGGPFQRLLHAGEALVEHLAAEQIFDLVVLLTRLVAAPVVFGELLHSLGRRRRKRIQLQLAEPCVVVQRAGQFFALGQHRLVEQLLDLLQRAIQVVLAQQLSASAVGFGGQPVGSGHALGATAQQLRERPARRRARHDVLADLFERLTQIHRRRQWIWTAGVRRVAQRVAPHRFSHRPFRPPRTPCRCAWPNTMPPRPIREPRRAHPRTRRRAAWRSPR